MNKELSLVGNNEFNPDNRSTDEVLLELSKYGDPSLWKGSLGWYCRVTVFVTGKGVKFEVVGECLEAPNEAVKNCYGLLIKAIEKVKNTNDAAEKSIKVNQRYYKAKCK